MFGGVALPLGELPAGLRERPEVWRRVHDRGGRREVQFLYRDCAPLLPVRHEGRLRLAEWGNRRGGSRVLPAAGWARLSAVEAGGWAPWAPEPVDVPAAVGRENGVWFPVRKGVRGLLVRDEHDSPHVYLLCEPASHYYRIMTRGDWMPVLIDERL